MADDSLYSLVPLISDELASTLSHCSVLLHSLLPLCLALFSGGIVLIDAVHCGKRVVELSKISFLSLLDAVEMLHKYIP